MINFTLNPSEIRVALKDTDLTPTTHWIQIGAHQYYVHPKSVGGWRRIIHLVEGKPVWIIYYFPNPEVKDLDSMKVSAETYFKDEPVKPVADCPDLYYVDPTHELYFNAEVKWEVMTQHRVAVIPDKLKTIESLLTPKGVKIYNDALLDISERLANRDAWVYDIVVQRYKNAHNTSKLDMTEIPEGEKHLVITAIKLFFAGAVDTIKYTINENYVTIVFAIEVK